MYLFKEYGSPEKGYAAQEATLEDQDLKEIKVFTDCADYYRAGNRKNGIYEIQSTEKEKFKVFCNMDLGGWTVIMKRDKLKDKTKFNRPMANYKSGFGDLNYNHWLGNSFYINRNVCKTSLFAYHLLDNILAILNLV